MKKTPIHWIGIVFLLLITFVIFTVMNLPFGIAFYATCIGQLVIIFTVSKILRDDFTANKTVKNFCKDQQDSRK